MLRQCSVRVTASGRTVAVTRKPRVVSRAAKPYTMDAAMDVTADTDASDLETVAARLVRLFSPSYIDILTFVLRDSGPSCMI